jgi:RNA-binding protein PNO1
MVVAHNAEVVVSSSTRKTRRKTSKKAARIAPENERHDEDINDTLDTTPRDNIPSARSTIVDGDDELMLDTNDAPVLSSVPAFEPLPASAQRGSLKSEIRRVPIPPHRISPLQKEWINIFGPLTELLGLQVRMNTQRKAVEIRVSS